MRTPIFDRAAFHAAAHSLRYYTFLTQSCVCFSLSLGLSFPLLRSPPLHTTYLTPSSNTMSSLPNTIHRAPCWTHLFTWHGTLPTPRTAKQRCAKMNRRTRFAERLSAPTVLHMQIGPGYTTCSGPLRPVEFALHSKSAAEHPGNTQRADCSLNEDQKNYQRYILTLLYHSKDPSLPRTRSCSGRILRQYPFHCPPFSSRSDLHRGLSFGVLHIHNSTVL